LTWQAFQSNYTNETDFTTLQEEDSIKKGKTDQIAHSLFQDGGKMEGNFHLVKGM
jgi:hypothetical protein